MTCADLASALRRQLLDEERIPAEVLARMSDGEVISDCFARWAPAAGPLSPEQLDGLIVSCDALEDFLTAVTVWGMLAERGSGAYEMHGCIRVVDALSPPVNMTYDTSGQLLSEFEWMSPPPQGPSPVEGEEA